MGPDDSPEVSRAFEQDGATTSPQIGVGATDELPLRVSTAVLTRTVFTHPETDEKMIVLERKASVRIQNDSPTGRVEAQPLGGASELKRVGELLKEIGRFNFDSDESKLNSDFRIQIARDDWPAVREFCEKHFLDPATGVIEADPQRELQEEFSDSLEIEVDPTNYRVRHLGIVVPAESDSLRLGAEGRSTVRVFNVFEVELQDPALISAILSNASGVSDSDLFETAVQRARESDGKGKATALAAFPFDDTAAFVERGDFTEEIHGHRLASNVPAIFAV